MPRVDKSLVELKWKKIEKKESLKEKLYQIAQFKE